MNKTITLERPIAETLTAFLGKLPVETGVAPIYSLLINALNAPVVAAAVAEPVVAKKVVKKRLRKERAPAARPIILEFMSNNPEANQLDVAEFLMSKGFSMPSAKNAVAKHFAVK